LKAAKRILLIVIIILLLGVSAYFAYDKNLGGIFSTATPTATHTATSIPATPTNIPTATPACLNLLAPENKSSLDAIGKVIFSWEPMQGAEKYLLEFTPPTGQPVIFDEPEPNHTRYLESFSMSGEFIWKVTTFDEKGNLICVSEPYSFIKRD